jgi:(p)ppGpp synthase/HD superfamily hydrolase
VLPSFVAELPLARMALRWASVAHGEQLRDSDRARFIIHPLEVASLLHNAGAGDAVIAAGILHDTVEDTELSRREIERAFGAAVASMVVALTEDPQIERYDQRKAALREQVRAADAEAAAVYAADKVAKVRELRTALTCRPPGAEEFDDASKAKLAHYRRSAEMLEQVMPEHALVRQLRFELEMLQMLPPGDRLLARDVRPVPG